MESLPAIPFAVGFIVTIFAYIRFLVSGGYTNSIDLIDRNGFIPEDTGNNFLPGTSNYLYSNYLLPVIAIILIAALIYAIRVMWVTEERKIFKISSVVLLVLGTLAPFIVFFISLFANSYDAYAGLLEGTITWAIVFCGASLVLGFVLLTRNPNSKAYFIRTISAAAAYFVVFPLLLWICENAIAIGAFIIGAICIMIMIAIFGGIMLAGPDSTGSSSGSASSNRAPSANAKKRKKLEDRKAYLIKKAKDYQYAADQVERGSLNYGLAGNIIPERNRQEAAEFMDEAAQLDCEISKLDD